jgi:hypothetical protein
MSEPDERHAAELAIVTAQRDALAGVVAYIWGNARDGYQCDPAAIEAIMVAAGVAEYRPATEDDIDGDTDVEVGDDVIQLSAFGRSCMAGAKPP